MAFVTRSDIVDTLDHVDALSVDINLAHEPSYAVAAHKAEQYLRDKGIEFETVDIANGVIRNVTFTAEALPPRAADWVSSYEIPKAQPKAQD